MKNIQRCLSIAVLYCMILISPTLAFLPPLSTASSKFRVASSHRAPRTTSLKAASFSDVCLSVAAAADEYEYGAVAAPGWVLPVGALLTLGLAVSTSVSKHGVSLPSPLKCLWSCPCGG
ncbi:hypothetical protein NGA_0710200 [Nannochloropsis gaditana CCMP526]|uniref:uncharacterized protein n=1 Tax=Nannochloropsis gaditana (strain CCMP526) TaxID=1093141 RepID=UPI00029F5917|nr:hypothetical protein NGA_0710200 [Nannochloropsis gaditana CCMP526]EKU23336.1 hypothetical protein NGA_0710200 [Nannochloropsis gaditana CCMP526]|eukprot:XP_005852497.1 hypothetical protein NGA_0710200 [Nannochloropsis gaditana CCMP526]